MSKISRTVPSTKLNDFLEANDVALAELARRMRFARQHLYRVRFGTQPVTKRFAEKLVPTLQRMLKRPIALEELFEPDVVVRLGRRRNGHERSSPSSE